MLRALPLPVLLLAACGSPASCPPPSDTHADSAPDSATDTGPIACGTVQTLDGVDFVNVCASTFDMGCTAAQPDNCGPNEPLHSVTLTHDYWLARTETTQAEFESVTGYNNAVHAGCPDCPIEWVSWYEAAAYANQRSEAAGLTSCYTCTGEGTTLSCVESIIPYLCDGYRLPTEAEWEGAARCGTDLVFSGSDTADDVAWYNDESGTTHEVAGKLPNACGTYDQSGNVIEWTHDWYSELSTDAVTDPDNPPDTADRVPRGGSYAQPDYFLRVSYRSRHNPVYQRELTGFRLARTRL